MRLIGNGRQNLTRQSKIQSKSQSIVQSTVQSRVQSPGFTPTPPSFLRATLKTWEWPGDEARQVAWRCDAEGPIVSYPDPTPSFWGWGLGTRLKGPGPGWCKTWTVDSWTEIWTRFWTDALGDDDHFQQ